MRQAIWLLFLFLSITASAAVEETFTFKSETDKSTYLKLTKELRCPQCQNQNIADSNAVVAVDMRGKVFELINQGKGHDEIVEHMITRYGYFVHYRPPMNWATSILWFAPLFCIICGVFVIAVRGSRGKKQEKQFSQEVLAQAKQLLQEKQ